MKSGRQDTGGGGGGGSEKTLVKNKTQEQSKMIGVTVE